MQLPRHEVAKIAKYRAGVEVRLAALLQKAGSNITLDYYKQAIFNGPGVSRFRVYLREALELFDCADIASASDEILSVIQDAWNYFPHSSLNGQCPAEVMAAGDLH